MQGKSPPRRVGAGGAERQDAGDDRAPTVADPAPEGGRRLLDGGGRSDRARAVDTRCADREPIGGRDVTDVMPLQLVDVEIEVVRPGVLLGAAP